MVRLLDAGDGEGPGDHDRGGSGGDGDLRLMACITITSPEIRSERNDDNPQSSRGCR